MSNIVEKICTKCKIPKEENENNFYRDYRKTPNKFKSLCKECYLENTNEDRIRRRMKNWQSMGFNQKPPRKRKHRDSQDRYLKKKYGINTYEYNVMLIGQNHKCYICNQEEITINISNKKIQRLSVDHNHNTKEIRKLLCNRCNSALGMAREDPTLLSNMAHYLESHSPTYEVPVGWC